MGKINDHGRINKSGIEIKKLPAEAGSFSDPIGIRKLTQLPLLVGEIKKLAGLTVV